MPKLLKFNCMVILILFSACVSLKVSKPQTTKAEYLAMISRGVEYLRQHDHEYFITGKKNLYVLKQAEAVFSLAKNLRASDPEAIDGLGSVQVRLGELGLARVLFLECLNRDAYYSRAYVHLAYVEELNGNKLISREMLQKAKTIGPMDSHALNNLGGILYDSNANEGERDEGRRMLMQAIEIGDRKNEVLKHNKRIIEKE